jgi:deoxyribose-phosphate aldolase
VPVFLLIKIFYILLPSSAVSKIENIAGYIDHTLLKPEATTGDIRHLCDEARLYNFASVCVNSSFVEMCRELLEGIGVKVCTVIGFPLGATSTHVKKYEAERAITDGAREIDMVMHIGKLKSKEYRYVETDITAVVQATHRMNVILKVILETTLLTEEEKIKACELCKNAGADFVKTSTGFIKGGATVNDIRLMRKIVGPDMGVKASGGIRTRRDAEAMILAGATRIGTSSGVQIVSGSDTSSAPGY